MAGKSYAVLYSSHNHTARLSWQSREGDAIYCGVCLRGQVKAELGHVCPNCQSHVRGVFEVIQGGKPTRHAGARHAVAAAHSTAEPFATAKSL